MHSCNLCYACGVCPMYFNSLDSLKQHRETKHVYNTKFVLAKSAHRLQARQYRMHFPDSVLTVDEAYKFARKEMRKLLLSTLLSNPSFRVNFVLAVEMYKNNEQGLCTALEKFSFRADGFTLTSSKNIKKNLDKTTRQMDRNIAEFLFQGSGWKVLRPFMLDAELVEVRPLAGGVGGGEKNLHVASYVRQQGIMPCEVSSKVEDDGFCFYAAVAAAVLGTSSLYGELEQWFAPAAKKFGPNVRVKDIGAIERFWQKTTRHKELSINVVYKDEDKRVIPVRVGSKPLSDSQVALLLSYTAEKSFEPDTGVHRNDIVCHYSTIKEPNQLFARRKKSEATGKISTREHKLCWNCLNVYYDRASLESHLAYCGENNCQRISMPKPGETIRYKEKSTKRQDGTYPTSRQNRAALQAAYVLYFDFEALNVEPEKACSCTPEMVQRRKEFEEEQLQWRNASVEQLADWTLEKQMLEGELSAELEEKRFHLNDVDNMKRADPIFHKPPRVSNKMCTHKTHVVSEQKAFAYSYCLMNREGQLLESKVAHSSKNAAECFLEDVLNISETYMPQLTPGKPMREMSSREMKKALAANACYLCDEGFDEEDRNLNRVMDHDHLTGDFLGVAHSICNLHRKEDYSLTCFSHNFSGYDSHFILKALNSLGPKRVELQGIPINSQKFKNLTVNRRIKFTDSAAFLNASLADCADTLVKSNHKFDLLDSICDDEKQKELLLRKGVYPYSFATSVKKLRKTKELPPKEAFYNDLTDTPVSDEDYEHAQKVWREFGVSNMMEYTTLYLRTDTLLLAEAMTELRRTMWKDFELDLTRYLSLPMMAKDIMLKTTGVELELITDQEMSDLVQKNLRGGLSFINKRKSQRGSHADLAEDDDRTITYIDCTNLYGKAMSMSLPMSDFAWMSEAELAAFNPETDVCDNGDTGYFLEVDLEYPGELHESHNSFPLAAQAMDLTEQDLSPYSYSCLQTLTGKTKYSARKLTSTFYPRTKYLCHGMNLKLYLQLGLKLVRIHRGIKFHQEKFIEPYIAMCSARRRTAPTEAQRNMYKLLCNSLYGKLIEGFEKRMKCKFNRDRETAMRHSSHPLYKGTMICAEDFSITFHKLGEIKMNQSWAVGFSILELSKYWMQKSFYEDIQPTFRGVGGCSVLMSDTDSFLLETRLASSDDVVERLKTVMDTSNYPPDHPLYCKDKAKVPGYFKNEIPHSEIDLFVGLKSKTYAIRCLRGKSEIKAKGVPERQKHKIPVEEMLNCLTEMRKVSLRYNALRSYDHVNKLVRSDRVAFSSFDDKRYLLCEIHSVPYGSRLISLSSFIGQCGLCVEESSGQTPLF